MRQPQLSGGISHQPRHLRLPSQVEYAVNAVFSVVTAGASKRAGTSLLHAAGTTNPSSTSDVYRLEKFIFADRERYYVQYGTTSSTGIVRVWDRYAAVNGVGEAYVSISSAAQTYLSTSPTVDRLRFVATPDRGYFVNTEVTPTASVAPLTGPIASVSVASAAVITDVGHGLSTGDYVTITGTDCTPNINNTYQVTVLSADTFSIPVTTTAVTTGTGNWYRGPITHSTWPLKMTRNMASSSFTVSSASVANPTVITTSAPHGLTTGQSVYISGATTTASINGLNVVTVTGASTFTIPVNVSSFTSGGTGYANAMFTIDVESWRARVSGTEATNPFPKFVTDGKKIRDICFERGRLWLAAGPYVIGSDASDRLNFFYRDASNIVDADKVTITLGQGIADVDYLVPINRAVLAFSRSGVQYEINTREDILSQTTVVATPMTRLVACGARPVVINQNVYFCVENARTAELRELQYDPINLPTTAEAVSDHASELMFMYKPQDGNKANIKSLAASGQNGTVFVFRTQFSSTSSRGSDVFDYRTRFNGSDRVHSSWSRQTFNDSGGNEYLMDILADGNDLILLRGYDPPFGSTVNWYIEAMPVLPISSHSVT